MEIKKLLTKSLLVAAGLCMGASAWAAGYTRTLQNTLEVPGYKAKAFYDFQNNNPEVLPTSGDLRYRAYEKGGYWGLHNHGSGARSGTATISVAATDILVIQEYSASDVTTINRGTENATLTSSTGYCVFDITTTADDITFSVPRNGGIVAALVMEKDASAATADYTINYQANNVTVKTESGNVAVGTIVPVTSSFIVESVKYLLDEGQPTSLTVATGGSTLNVTVSEAPKYSYTVKTSLGATIASGSNYSGETIYYHYAQMINNNGTLYEAAQDNNGYKSNFVLDQDGKVVTKAYNATSTANVVFLGEGENLFTSGTGSNADIRLSLGAGGYVEGDKVAFVTLPAGKYRIYLQNRCSGTIEAKHKFFKGDEEEAFYSADGNGYNAMRTSDPFTLTESTTLYMQGGDQNNLVDWIAVYEIPFVSVPCTNGWATYANHEKDLDFTGVEGLTAFTATVSGDVVTFTPATKVPAGTGVLLKGATADVNVTSGAPAISENVLYAPTTAVEGLEYDQDGFYNYILTQPEGKKVGFYQANNNTIAVGKAYLRIPQTSGARKLTFIGLDGENLTTAIADVKAQSNDTKTFFNINGQRIAAPQKGLYIVNGKKVVIK